VGNANHQIYKEVYKAACDSHFCLTLGGDHSIGIGSLSGILHARPDSAVVWVDAHADINTPYTSGSGNAHGMVLSFLMNLANAKDIHGFEWLKQLPPLNPSRLVYIGLRDLDAGEKHILRALNIRTFTMHDVDKYGIGKVMELALDHIIGRVARPVHLSLDIDSIDPMFAPSTGTRVAGGLTYREAYYVCEALAETKCLSSMDMVEVNPKLNQSGSEQTIQMAVGLISSALGNRIL
jgi:arginase